MAHLNSAEGIQNMCATQINDLQIVCMMGRGGARLSVKWGLSFNMGPFKM